MSNTKAEVIFHPVRIRIVQALFGDRKLTAQQLLGASGGTSMATLYRHLNRLVEAGVIAVVEERPVRGTVEKVYALAHDQAATFTPEEARQDSAEDRVRHFNTIVGTLLGDFGRYVGQASADPATEGVIVRQDAVNLTDEEALELGKALKAALAPYKGRPEDGTRRRRLLSTILLPVVEATDSQEEEL